MLCFFAFLTSPLWAGNCQYGDKKIFTENFLYYIDSFGWVKIMKEGKKAPGQYSKFVLKVCIYAIFNVNYQGWVGIGSLFLNLLSCKSVSAFRLLPSLPALLLTLDIFCSKSIDALCPACCSVMLMFFYLRAMCKLSMLQLLSLQSLAMRICANRTCFLRILSAWCK